MLTEIICFRETDVKPQRHGSEGPSNALTHVSLSMLELYSLFSIYNEHLLELTHLQNHLQNVYSENRLWDSVGYTKLTKSPAHR